MSEGQDESFRNGTPLDNPQHNSDGSAVRRRFQPLPSLPRRLSSPERAEQVRERLRRVHHERLEARLREIKADEEGQDLVSSQEADAEESQSPATQSDKEQLSDEHVYAEEESDEEVVTSRFFDQFRHVAANLAERKRPAVDSDLKGQETDSDYH